MLNANGHDHQVPLASGSRDDSFGYLGGSYHKNGLIRFSDLTATSRLRCLAPHRRAISFGTQVSTS